MVKSAKLLAVMDNVICPGRSDSLRVSSSLVAVLRFTVLNRLWTFAAPVLPDV